MNAEIRVAILACLGTLGCYNGLDLSGSSMEGYESFGRAGGTMQTPDGAVEVEVEEDALVREVDLTVGRLDDCFAGALACYEIEPAGLKLRKPVTVNVDLLGVEDSYLVDAQSLAVYVFEGGSWREVTRVESDDGPTAVPLTTLGPLAIAPTGWR